MSPTGFRVLWPDVGLEGTMKPMAGRKRHSAEDIVRKLRRADESSAEGKTGEEVAAELGVSAATLYNWRRTYGGMDTDAAKELKELREQSSPAAHPLDGAPVQPHCEPVGDLLGDLCPRPALGADEVHDLRPQFDRAATAAPLVEEPRHPRLIERS